MCKFQSSYVETDNPAAGTAPGLSSSSPAHQRAGTAIRPDRLHVKTPIYVHCIRRQGRTQLRFCRCVCKRPDTVRCNGCFVGATGKRLAETVRWRALPNKLQCLALRVFFNGMKQAFLQTAVRVHTKSVSRGRRSINPLIPNLGMRLSGRITPQPL